MGRRKSQQQYLQSVKPTSGSNTALDVVSFLGNWFAYHILGTDMRFGLFVEAQNVGRRIRSLKPAF